MNNKILLDTNVMLWLFLDSSRLNEKFLTTIKKADDIYLSIVSFWEIGIKQSGKGYDDLELPSDWHVAFKKIVEDFQLKWLPISVDCCRRIEDLPFHHKDPFDRMIIVQAMENDLAVMTSDKVFKEYDVQVIS
jgi:PIN domain nuclease of toxin-antitoxin system